MKKYRLNKEKFSEFIAGLLTLACVEGIWLYMLLEISKPL